MTTRLSITRIDADETDVISTSPNVHVDSWKMHDSGMLEYTTGGVTTYLAQGHWLEVTVDEPRSAYDDPDHTDILKDL